MSYLLGSSKRRLVPKIGSILHFCFKALSARLSHLWHRQRKMSISFLERTERRRSGQLLEANVTRTSRRPNSARSAHLHYPQSLTVNPFQELVGSRCKMTAIQVLREGHRFRRIRWSFVTHRRHVRMCIAWWGTGFRNFYQFQLRAKEVLTNPNITQRGKETGPRTIPLNRNRLKHEGRMLGRVLSVQTSTRQAWSTLLRFRYTHLVRFIPVPRDPA